MKYSSLSEAAECFNQLISNVNDTRHLVSDVKNFFRSFGHILKSSPLFVQVFDLDDGSNCGKNGDTNSTLLIGSESNEIVSKPEVNLFELDLDSFDLF